MGVRERIYATSWGQRLHANEFLRHVTVLMSATAVSQAIPMLAAPIVSRLFTAPERGEYAIFMSLVGGLVTIAALRYDLAIVLPEKEADARGLTRLATRLAIAMSVLFTLVLLVFSGPIGRAVDMPHLWKWAPIVGLVGFAYASVGIYNYWCNRRKNYALMGSNKLIQAVGTSGSSIGLGVASLGAFGLVASQLIGQTLGAASLAWRTRAERRGPASPIRGLLHEYRRMPLLNGPNAVVDSVRLNGIPLLIASGFGTSVTGQFNYAWTLMQVPVGIANASLGQVFYQRLARTPAGQMFGLVSRSMVRLAAVAVVPFALLWWINPWLFPFVLGREWTQSGLIGRALVPWLFVNFITAPISSLFIVVKRQGVMLAFAVAYAAVPLALLYWHGGDPVATLSVVSLAMAALLVIHLALALWVSKDFDHRPNHPRSSSVEAEPSPAV